MAEPSPQTVETLFLQATDLAPEQRTAFLDAQCAGDSQLRDAVEELLRFDETVQREPFFLRSPVAGAHVSFPAIEKLPTSIGRYRIVRVLGRGGMGTVYEAQQDEPRRTVALKVMRQGLESADARKRFLQEASILQRLNHIGIARMYEAGSADDGQLFFAMEFIRGLPLGEYVRFNAADTDARLELAARICDAVQHSHEHAVIHRDLKPANIIVDDTGQPKVLDSAWPTQPVPASWGAPLTPAPAN